VDDFTVNNHHQYFSNEHRIQYYRKNYELHEIMQELYRKKTNSRYITQELNETFMRITIDDLETIGRDTATSTQTLIVKIHKVLESGDYVYYLPYW
jgi:hypothetical protein